MKNETETVNFKHSLISITLEKKNLSSEIIMDLQLYSFQKTAIQFCTLFQAYGHYSSFSDPSPLKVIAVQSQIS